MQRLSPIVYIAPLVLAVAGGPARGQAEPLEPIPAPKPPVEETYLGVFTCPVPESLAVRKREVLAEKPGLLVTHVLPASPADEAGLKQNDILLSYNKNSLSSPQQLKNLVAHEAEPRPVTVEYLRDDRILTAETPLARRVVIRPTSVDALGLDSRVVRLQTRGATPVLILPADKTTTENFSYRLKAVPAPQKPRAEELKSQSITLSSDDGLRWELNVSRVEEDGDARNFRWTGSPQQIEESASTAAPPVAEEVRNSLEWARKVKSERALRLQFQPRLEGERQVIRVRLSHPQEDGSIRLLVYDYTYDEANPAEVVELIRSEPLSTELKRLSPVVRNNVEQTLRGTALPTVRLELSRSQ